MESDVGDMRQNPLLQNPGTFHDLKSGMERDADVRSMPDRTESNEHRSEIGRVIQLALAFCVIFMPFSAAQNFQTSQADPIMGARALSLLYVTFTMANLLSGQIVQFVGLRASMFFGSLAYVAFVFSNSDYKQWMVYSSSVLLGVGAAMLWTAQGAFVTRLSNQHDITIGKLTGSSLGFFNGIFFAIFQANQILGNLIIAFMFQFELDISAIFKICSFICGIGSMLLLFVSPPATTLEKLPSVSLILKTLVSQFNDSRLLLLVPFMLLNGVTISFIVGDLASFASTNRTRFLVMAVWGAFDALASIGFGKLADRIGRAPVIALGIGIHCIVTGLLLLNTNVRVLSVWLFILAFGFGCVDAVYNTTIYATMGNMFVNPESAFANFKLFQSGMIAAAFFYREYTDVTFRLNIIAAMIFIASVSLYVLKRRLRSL